MDQERKEVLELCIEVFKGMGLRRFSKLLEDYLSFPDERNLEKVFEEGLAWTDFSKAAKQRSFSFGTRFTMNKYLIATAASKYNDNGEPIIAINELPDETASFKDNPIKNLFIVYSDEEEREKDYERVRFIMK